MSSLRRQDDDRDEDEDEDEDDEGPFGKKMKTMKMRPGDRDGELRASPRARASASVLTRVRGIRRPHVAGGGL